MFVVPTLLARKMHYLSVQSIIKRTFFFAKYQKVISYSLMMEASKTKFDLNWSWSHQVRTQSVLARCLVAMQSTFAP